jgi:hypothetical protein
MLANPFDKTTIPEVPTLDEVEPDVPSRSPSAGKTSPAEQGLEIPMGWKPTLTEPVPVVRCTANASTTGERCKRWSLRGATTCRKHGAQLPSVREHAEAVVESARMRLFGLADEAVDVIEDIIQNSTQEQMKLKAAEMVLNRAGIKDAIEISVEVKENASLAEDIEKRLAIMRERRLAAEKEAAEAEAELIDEGEIVDEPEADDADEV